MKRAQSKSKAKRGALRVSQKEIGQLQQAVLRSILTGQPLPGSNRPITFPDLSFVLRQPAILVRDANLATPPSLADYPKPIRVVAQADIESEAHAHGDVSFLQFQPPGILNDNEVELTLEARIAPRTPAKGMLGLSNVHVKFRKVASKWEVIGEPVFSAA